MSAPCLQSMTMTLQSLSWGHQGNPTPPRWSTDRQFRRSGAMNPKVVLITGALTGIGRAAALASAKEANRVVVSGRRDEAGQALATELRALGAEAEFIRADVRHEDEVRSLVDRAVARFGRLDAAVNAAGTEGQPGPVTEQTAD